MILTALRMRIILKMRRVLITRSSFVVLSRWMLLFSVMQTCIAEDRTA